MSETKAKILLVEDEAHLAIGLKLNLQLEGFLIDVASTAREAAQFLLHPEQYQLIVLDIMLPDMDGFSLCRQLREAGNFTPLFMLTARSSAEDRVLGLEVGADDYIVKPFELSELLARIRSALRRSAWNQKSPEPNGAILQFAQVALNVETRQVTRRGELIPLTRLEFDLLQYFIENPNRVITRGELLEKVWRLKNYPNARTVDNFLARLRKYFEADPQNPIHFLSIRGKGYRFVPVG
jgi:DNA-binding response OmpR family regulator